MKEDIEKKTIKLEIILDGEIEKKYSSFTKMCKNTGITPEQRIKQLMLGDTLIYERVIGLSK
jgi:hypothetical protein